MKTIKLDRDEFAIFIANELLTIKNYNYDMFYDISKIVNNDKDNRGNTEIPQKETFQLMIRDTGSDLINIQDDNLSIYEQRSDKIYNLNFCYNCDYMYNESFCTVQQLK